MGARLVVVIDGLVATWAKRLSTFATEGINRVDSFATIRAGNELNLDFGWLFRFCFILISCVEFVFHGVTQWGGIGRVR